MNVVHLTGHLGKDPELRSTTSGQQVVNVSLATRGRGGKAPPDWHRLELWDKTAALISQYCKKGSHIGVTGRIKYSQWKDKDGKTRHQTDIVVYNLEFLDSKPRSDPPPMEDELDDSIPF